MHGEYATLTLMVILSHNDLNFAPRRALRGMNICLISIAGFKLFRPLPPPNTIILFNNINRGSNKYQLLSIFINNFLGLVGASYLAEIDSDLKTFLVLELCSLPQTVQFLLSAGIDTPFICKYRNQFVMIK